MDSLDSTLGTKYNSQDTKGEEMKPIPEGTEGKSVGESPSYSPLSPAEDEDEDEGDGPEAEPDEDEDEDGGREMENGSTDRTSRGLKTGTGEAVRLVCMLSYMVLVI